MTPVSHCVGSAIVLLLALDTATPVVTVAVHDGDRVLAECCVDDARRHGELLAPLISEVLAEAGARTRDLTAIAAGVGPGPYTGLRVGIVSAATMAHALGIPTYGVCSLDAFASRAAVDASFVVLTDARRKEVYWARYDAAGARVEGPDVQRPAALRETQPGPFVGPGARLYGELLDDVRGPFEQSAAALAELALERAAAAAVSEPLRPLYLRRPDAMEPRAPKAVT